MIKLHFVQEINLETVDVTKYNGKVVLLNK